eukprot:14366655-Alexandrium_andersonii.AAC.1
MSASLVGSEMCIRDRPPTSAGSRSPHPWPPGGAPAAGLAPTPLPGARPVSYTHLTLPTICC